MAARLRCQLDPSGRVLHLRPFASESCRRTFARTAGAPDLPAADVLQADHRTHLRVRRLPACCFSSRGPCVLRFTCADISRCMEAPMNLVQYLGRRARGLQHPRGDSYCQHELWTQWEENGWSDRIYTYVLGGCRHKWLYPL
nr:X Protein [Domestic donkey hepatitis B virus]QMV34959.1 X protein [Equine hepatitis B virus]